MSGSSVRTSTMTSPAMPCALTTRPTTRSMGALLVGVRHVDAGIVGGLLGGHLLLGRGGLGARAALGRGQRGVEQIEIARLGLLDLQRPLRARQALELLPVAGDLRQLQDGFGRLGADAEPV